MIAGEQWSKTERERMSVTKPERARDQDSKKRERERVIYQGRYRD
jgi:hypothetical protein